MTSIPGRPDWAGQPFNVFMTETFPAFLTKWGAIDVHKIREPLGKSHERIYQMLRKGQLTTQNARDLCDLANTADNVAALKEKDRNPPVLADFFPFIPGLN